MRFDLSDAEWALLEPLLQKSRRSARIDDRKIVNAIFYVLRTGMPGVICRRATVLTNPCHRRQQRSAVELHGDWRAGPWQPSRRRDTEHTSITIAGHCRRSTTAKKYASRSRTKALCRSSRTAAAPPRKPIAPSASTGGDTNRKLLLLHQGLAAHRNPPRQACPQLPSRRYTRRRTLLDQIVSLDPSSKLGEYEA